MLPGVTPITVPPNLPTLTYLTAFNSSVNTASVSLGNATPTTPGLLIVAVVSRSTVSRSIEGVSIGGTTGTNHLTTLATTQNNGMLTSRVVTSGNQNVTIVFSTTSTGSRHYAAAWLLTGYASTTPYDSTKTFTAGASTGGTTFDIPQNGVAVYATLVTTGAGPNITFTSATTRNLFGGPNVIGAAADKVATSPLTSFAEGTGGVVTSPWVVVGGSWR